MISTKQERTAPAHDVLIVGGGMSGVAAAVAAARAGAATLLVERHGCLGGMATMGLVNPFMTHFRAACQKPGEEAVGGLFEEILQRVDAEVPLVRNAMWRGNTAFDSEVLKWVLDDLVRGAGVRVLFGASLSGATASDGRVRSVALHTKAGGKEVAARVFVDASGDADLASMCGCPLATGREVDGRCQAMTLMFRVSNVRLEAAPDRKECTRLYQSALAAGRVGLSGKKSLWWFPYPGEGVVTFNQNEIVGRIGLSAEELTEAQFEGRAAVRETFRFLRREVPGFEHCRVEAMAPAMGVRETRRIVGCHLLTAEELLGEVRFEDTIACGAYPVDIHDPDGKRDIPMRTLKESGYYDIPYRSLQPVGADNLLVAGRCLSATHEAAAAVRIMPICTAMGQAAGEAAAMAAARATAVGELNTVELRRRLVAGGAFLGTHAPQP